MKDGKPFNIPKQAVWTAYKKVKANQGSAGIDGQNLADFEKDLKNNLYKIWNRMSSGSYLPPPVKAVEIPKKAGGTRRLGIPTVSDRIAQMVAKMYMEPYVEIIFHEDSYGYRPNKSALDAVGQARQRCWKYDYVIEFDIRGLFDNIDHKLLMKAVRKHVKEPWAILYIERWLRTPFILENGDKIERNSGTPQGGVISPILANLFMHYAFDMWMKREYPHAPFERYADDAIIHCKTESEAKDILERLDQRLKECKLELHPQKTKIVYCKDSDRNKDYPNTEFDFLGYTFHRIFIKDRLGRMNFNFLAGVSKKATKSLRDKIKELKLSTLTGRRVEDIAVMINPMVRGWLNYFSKFNKTSVRSTMRCLNLRLVRWAMRKYKRFKSHKVRAIIWLQELAKREPNMFAHWALGWRP